MTGAKFLTRAVAAAALGLALGSGAALAQSANALIGEISAQCAKPIAYEADCKSAIRSAANAQSLSDEDKTKVAEAIAKVIAENPNMATDIQEIATQANLTLPAAPAP